MTGTGTCRKIRLELGVYVLGAIEAADRSAVEAHVACCAYCRDELARLAGLPELLNRVSPDDAESLVWCRDDSRGSNHEVLAGVGLRRLLGRAARLRPQHMWPRMAATAGAGLIVGAGAAAATERCKTIPYRTRRATSSKQGGE